MMQEQARDDQCWVIWSEEHLMWWRPNSRGYTQQLSRAGRYTEEVAKSVESSANMAGERFNEVALKLPDAFDDLSAKETHR